MTVPNNSIYAYKFTCVCVYSIPTGRELLEDKLEDEIDNTLLSAPGECASFGARDITDSLRLVTAVLGMDEDDTQSYVADPIPNEYIADHNYASPPLQNSSGDLTTDSWSISACSPSPVAFVDGTCSREGSVTSSLNDSTHHSRGNIDPSPMSTDDSPDGICEIQGAIVDDDDMSDVTIVEAGCGPSTHDVSMYMADYCSEHCSMEIHEAIKEIRNPPPGYYKFGSHVVS